MRLQELDCAMVWSALNTPYGKRHDILDKISSSSSATPYVNLNLDDLSEHIVSLCDKHGGEAAAVLHRMYMSEL